ncbi:Similar to ZFP28: Zinc finger protein 28 homolog (Homo sapiens) [Cotesia congregata]|uniref:Similar to ZFP28: Zinc finger protein 28 homolog (Homo sapiens) n=1 Tax=Cotesia congregata TaxID=51543 RepID=A0A8J2HDQ8_COTCN|nr:Similar to ZFP28: Zinc finger protein 28 homolog (Homo sapiens) [Cotesia congregata]
MYKQFWNLLLKKIDEDKLIRLEQHVTQHLKTHEAKQWECDVCSKMFTTEYFLKKHKRLHSGEMPYKCNICNKTFTFQQSYHKHRLYHKDDKPHTCTTCDRSFKELSMLHNNERIHTGEKPFACETCVQTAEAKESLSDHSENSSGGNDVIPEIDKDKNLGISEVKQENKFVLVVDNGQPILKHEQEINSTLSQECSSLLQESLQINDPDDFYPFFVIRIKNFDEPFQEAPDLYKDIKHAIDGILQERREINALETINDESFKQLLYEIDKKI